jgi:DNA-binding LytR/AlgR family response regulator
VTGTKPLQVHTYLRWLKVQIGTKLRMIAVDDVDYLRSDAKYTVVAWRNDEGQPAEALVRTALKDLVRELDPSQFAQVHRSAAVNLGAISHMIRGDHETGILHLKGRTETLPVSRAHLGQFRPMQKTNR